MYNFLDFFVLLNLILKVGCLDFVNKWTTNGQWIASEPNKIIMTFSNQTVYLPCAMQSVNNFHQPTQDQLTLILWYYDTTTVLNIKTLNTTGPPIYSVDFRNSKNDKTTNQQNAIHFISDGQFKNRILFEFDICQAIPETNQLINKTFNRLINRQIIYYYNQFNRSLKSSIKPICAFLKLNQIQLTDTGRYSCRLDFRRSRTLHSSFLLKVLEKPKHFEVRLNERTLVNNSIIRNLNEGSSLIVHCSVHMIDKNLEQNDLYLQWQCDNNLNGFYSNEYEKHIEPGKLKSELKIKHLYRIFSGKSCSCFLISNFGQRLTHLQIYFELYLAPVSVFIIKPTSILNSTFELNSSQLKQELSFKNQQHTLKLEIGQLIDLQCFASGSRPASNCKWSLVNGFQFKSKDYSELTSVESNSGSAQLTEATFSTLSTLHLLATNQLDNQIIRCTCSNPLILPLVKLTDQIHLEMQSKPILQLMPYELKNKTKINKELIQIDYLFKPFKYQVKEGATVRLICDIVKSNPSINGNIQWFINDIELKYFRRIHPNATVLLEQSADQQLVIQNVIRDTIGQVVCMAKNDKGTAQSNLIILDVQYIPFCRSSQKILYSLALGETIDVNCDLYADPLDAELQFHWSLNKQPLPNSMFTIESVIENEHQISDQIKWRPLNSNIEKELYNGQFNGAGHSNFKYFDNEHFNKNKFYNDRTLVRSKLKFDSTNYHFKHSTLECWAINSIGHQKESCLFSLLVIAKPEVPNNCSIQFHELDERSEERQIEIGCLSGNNNGLLQTLHLNVYRLMAGGLTNMPKINSTTTINTLNTFKTLNNATNIRIRPNIRAINSVNISSNFMLSSDQIIHSSMHPTSIQHNHHFIGQFNHLSVLVAGHLDRRKSVVDLFVNQSIAINQTNQYIRFRKFNLSIKQNYLFIIFSSNAKGQSEQVEFEWTFDSVGSTELTQLNYYQIFILTAYFLVGIILAIFLSYLFFTLIIYLKLQFVIVNHRFLDSISSSKDQEQTSNQEERPFLIQNQSYNCLFNELTNNRPLRMSNVYSNLNEINTFRNTLNDLSSNRLRNDLRNNFRDNDLRDNFRYNRRDNLRHNFRDNLNNSLRTNFISSNNLSLVPYNSLPNNRFYNKPTKTFANLYTQSSLMNYVNENVYTSLQSLDHPNKRTQTYPNKRTQMYPNNQ